MADNELAIHANLPRASRNSKKGWQPVSGSIPPDLHQEFMAIVATGALRTDLVHEAVALLVEARRAA